MVRRKRMGKRVGALLLCLALLFGMLPAGVLRAAQPEQVSQEEEQIFEEETPEPEEPEETSDSENSEETASSAETGDDTKEEPLEDSQQKKEPEKEDSEQEETPEEEPRGDETPQDVLPESEPQDVLPETEPQVALPELEPQIILEEAEPEYQTYQDLAEVHYNIQVQKTDWQTGAGLEGCLIDIYEDEEKLVTLPTGVNGEISYTVTKSESFDAVYCSNYDSLSEEKKASVTGCTSEEEAAAEVEGKMEAFQSRTYSYSIREVTAPTGYVLQEDTQQQSIAGEETAFFTVTGERTLGAVKVILYDTETESSTRQGDAASDGAVYGIYAAEEIWHPDGKTGILFEEDQLVATAVIGESPKCDENGYILNKDGTRHVEYPEMEIAFEETPGMTLFGDLELGSYYVRETAPAKGYMLDEAVYAATFTYQDQTTRVVERNENSKDAKNELMADDRIDSHHIYSGDYVVKQGLMLLSTLDDPKETGGESLDGIGYCVYLVSELSKVRDGTIKPVNGEWGPEDLPTFDLYDFTWEERASVYKRTFRETWTSGDSSWLYKVEGRNKYRSKIMYTNEAGQIETPELPYGTYVFVEMITREGHVARHPFLVQITRDGGVLYTDGTKQTIEKTYTVEESIRYGDHKATKKREGRLLREWLLDQTGLTQTFLRLIKVDEESLQFPGPYIKAEETVHGTILKEGASYRVRCRSVDQSRENIKALGWECDEDGYLSCPAPDQTGMMGTPENPFRTTLHREEGKITDCYITLPRAIPVGVYELTELTAPSGYVVNGKEQMIRDASTNRENSYIIEDTPRRQRIFYVTNLEVYPEGQIGASKYLLRDQNGNLTVTVFQENRQQRGIVQIYKHGERLAGYENEKFIYQDMPMEGVSFQIVAAEDIYTQELQRELMQDYAVDTSGYLAYREGDIVASIVTDRNGRGYAADLYIGKYRIEETSTESGFVLDDTAREFEITPQEQTVNFDIQDVDIKNERQKLAVEVIKTDSETGKPLSGAVFGLYAAEDIDSLVSEGTLVATCTTDEAGKGIFEKDLPLARYIVRELEAPEGYLSTNEEIVIDGSYEDPTVPVRYLSAAFENEPAEPEPPEEPETPEEPPKPEEPETPEEPPKPEEPGTPEEPPKPEEPETPDRPDKTDSQDEPESSDEEEPSEPSPQISEQSVTAPATGDYACWYVWAAGALAAAGILFYLFRLNKKKR